MPSLGDLSRAETHIAQTQRSDFLLKLLAIRPAANEQNRKRKVFLLQSCGGSEKAGNAFSRDHLADVQEDWLRMDIRAGSTFLVYQLSSTQF